MPKTARRLRRSRCFWSNQGSSLPEVVVTVGMSGLILGLGVLGINAKFIDLSATARNLTGEIRRARMNAVTRGAHYRVVLSESAYRVERMQDSDGDGVWTPGTSAPVRRTDLPAGISLSVLEDGPSAIEFDTRGMIVPQDDAPVAMVAIQLTEANGTGRAGGRARIEVWPSGQIDMEEEGG